MSLRDIFNAILDFDLKWIFYAIGALSIFVIGYWLFERIAVFLDEGEGFISGAIRWVIVLAGIAMVFNFVKIIIHTFS